MKSVLETDVKTFTVNACKLTQNIDEGLLYISSISKDTGVVYVKPISSTNVESISKAREIVTSGRLSTISKTSNGLILSVYEALVTSLSKPDYKVVIEFKGKKIDIEQVDAICSLDKDCYSIYAKFYGNFVTDAHNQVKAIKAKRKEAIKV